ncbi:MAG: RNA 3'-phosphate cyclase [Desulfovibrionaceae bacterium]|nr:RNA 3'-phosphate cyclase [Desulfovibrionaceae bacterium]
MRAFCTINGENGEGGGQILRTALALSLATGVPFHMVNIRSKRPKPGLRPQHLACVLAAQTISSATVRGAVLDSKDLIFEPGPVKAGDYTFAIGSGGSSTLVLQALVPPLLIADGPSQITVIGGTHVPKAPCFEFLRDALFPRLRQMGPAIDITMERVGYMDKGEGRLTVRIDPVKQLTPLHLEGHAPLTGAKAILYAEGLSEKTIAAECAQLLHPKYTELGVRNESISVNEHTNAQGKGVAVVIRTEHGLERMVFAEYGEPKRPPTKVAEIAARHALAYVQSESAVDYNLGDQLLVPMALAGAGSMTVSKITNHLTTCLMTIGLFLDCAHSAPTIGEKNVRVSLEVRGLRDLSGEPALDLTEYPRTDPVPWTIFGEELIDTEAKEQLINACLLPCARRAALLPDAHKGYGLPIGGVLAVKNAVIPYAVGVDIACRMRLTVLDMPTSFFDKDKRNILRQALKKETRFGVGCDYAESEMREHPVMEEDWDFSEIVKANKLKARKQLGTSGSGNHFVEFGELVLEKAETLGGVLLPAGTYLALLSHSGSRGTGEAVATFYSSLARQKHLGLPNALCHLACLDMDSADGQEYWAAMQLMGRYAAANHELIHSHILKNLGVQELLHVENHHNFAWKEIHDGEEVIVHRKGATPAGSGIEGIIPGSMGSEAYVVRGLGNNTSLCSCSHGAGRVMSRAEAFRSCALDTALQYLEDKGVEILAAQIDEAPMVYKDIATVMAAQKDLVDVLARFYPRMVLMAPPEGGKRKRKEVSLGSWR